ncbi:hypothetical protein [Clostridium rhizosphaerae]
MWLSRGVLRIPMLYLSGIIADSYNKKKIITVTNLISVIFAFLFIFANNERIWLVYILAFLLQSLNDIDVSSETAILPEIVSKEELSYSNETYKVAVSYVLLNIKPKGIIYFDYALAIGGLTVPFIVKALSQKSNVKIFILSTVVVGIGYI